MTMVRDGTDPNGGATLQRRRLERRRGVDNGADDTGPVRSGTAGGVPSRSGRGGGGRRANAAGEPSRRRASAGRGADPVVHSAQGGTRAAHDDPDLAGPDLDSGR